MKNLKFNSIFTRLFISFLLIVTPIIISGIAMFEWERQTIQSQIEASAFENISFLKNTLESEITNIMTLQYNLAIDDTLIKLITNSYLEQREYYNLIRDIEERLTIMKNSNKFIDDVKVYFPALGYTISGNYYAKLDMEEYGNLLKVCINAKYPLIIDNTRAYTLSSYPLSINKNETPLFLIKTEISHEKLNKFLDGYSKYVISETALYDHSSQYWTFSDHNDFKEDNDAELSLIENSKGNSQNTIVNIRGKPYAVISLYSSYLNITFVQYVPFEDLFSVPKKYSAFLWFFTVLSVIIVIIYSKTVQRFVTHPVNVVLKAYKQVEQGNFSIRVKQKAAPEFTDLYNGFNKMVIHLNDLIDKVYRQELYARKSELKQLQAQINPHFLYNSYFMLDRMIRTGDVENAQAMSLYLGKYFRYITRDSADEVTLFQEAEHAYSYAQIQQMRFSKQMRVEFGEVPEGLRNVMLPRLILQPLIENAIEHGIKNIEQDGLLRVTFVDSEGVLLITVEDSGESLTDEEIGELCEKLIEPDGNSEVTALLNVHRRLVLKYGTGNGIRLYRSSLGGLKVEIVICPGS